MENRLGENVKTLLTESGIQFVGFGLKYGISFISTLVMARLLGQVEYGGASIGITILAVVSTLVLIGLDTGVSRNLPREDAAGKRGMIFSAGEIVLPISIGFGTILVILAPALAVNVFHDASIASSLRIFGLAIPIAAVMKLAVGAIRGTTRAAPRVYIQNVTLPISRLVFLLIFISLGLGAVGVAWAYLLSYMIAAALATYFVVKLTPVIKSGPTPRMYRTLLSFSAPLIVASIMRLVLSDIDILMIGYLKSTVDVAEYNVIYQLSSLTTVFLSSVSYVFLPLLSKIDNDGNSEMGSLLYRSVAKWLFVVTLPFIFVLISFPELTLSLIFGSEYVSGAPALVVLTLGFFIHTIFGPNVESLASIGETRTIMRIDVVAAVTNVFLNVTLIPMIDILGAAVATTLSYILMNIMYSRRLYRIEGYYPFARNTAPTLIAMIVITIIATICIHVVQNPVLQLVVCIIFLIGFFTIIYLLAIGEDERAIFESITGTPDPDLADVLSNWNDS
ncbi:flippase [Halorubrum ezzemoulense]|uniref:flippase n=1 Tax=Halorubrum ezzemoulense TaxID=337243 RepID=UPI00232E37DE|nr:flippase [Halorubrum ezzemoulense]MDB9300326.1 flippase [Halorubrum ezzemoulense]